MNPSRRVALVAAIYLGTFIASLDISIVNLALPTLQYALDTDLAGLQWVVDAYALCLSAFMLSSGPLSDRYGRKLTWLLGVGLLGFLFVERRTARPLLPLGLFRQAGFAVCNLASFVLGFSGYASLFFLSLFFQQVQGASAQQAGFYLAPQFLAMGALSMLFGRLQRHVPLRRLLVLGYLVIGLAMLALAACGTGTAYPWVGLLLVALGLGMGLAVPGTGLAVMASVARERSGMASATMNTLRQAGMAVGIALLGALLSGRAIVVLGDRLEELGIADAQRLATQAITAHRLPGSLAGLDAELPAALAEGFRLAMLVAGASALLAAALLWRLRVSAGPAADTVGASGRTAGVQLQADRR
ncbi:TPA: MFS transporter [Pseudomonas aeruginosa]|uniref:MFS transporter n=1 Tax=Pseudomonas aeruginosa TaxID=287 RepID=UPI001CBC187F|nr:MFS transporter [Pseudomonas aeruginosa]HCI1865588.1 MFS transporter [Pseudomonas aeruginosa]HCI2645407.1 MFS transporter [Pseudomonas aeruginosa]